MCGQTQIFSNKINISVHLNKHRPEMEKLSLVEYDDSWVRILEVLCFVLQRLFAIRFFFQKTKSIAELHKPLSDDDDTIKKLHAKLILANEY